VAVGGVVMRVVRVAACFVTCFFFAGCASTQLNFNALDLASSSEDLITSQVLYNLAKVRSSPYAIPAQVNIPSGSATTTNAVTPTLGGPIGPSLTTTLANSAASPLFNATTKTHLNPNSTVSVSVGDQWSQNWTLTPLSDPDQLRRLRALYRFGAGWTDEGGLACEYPVVQKPQGGTGSSQTVNVYIDGKKPETETPEGPKDNSYSVPQCPKRIISQVDAAFVKPPGCVLCDYKNKHELVVNHELANNWLWDPARPSLYGEPLPLGHYGRQDLYLMPTRSPACGQLSEIKCSEKEFSDFVLFVLEATLQSTSAAGGGKGSPLKSGAPGVLQEKAAPQFQILQ
jgi:hypothetical protein